MKPIHQSTAKLAADCLARYHAEVVQGIQSDNGFSQLGTIVHASIEEGYRAAVDGRDQLDAALATLDDSWNKRDKATTPTWVYAEAESMLRSAYHPESNLWLRKPKGVSMAVEQVFRLDADFNAVPADHEDVAYAGRMDAIQWGKDGARVYDWKTIRSMPGAQDLEDDIQARIYSLAALAMLPNAQEVTFSLVLLRHGYETSVTFKRGEAWEARTKRWLRAIRAAVAWAHDLDEWPATVGAGCGWCPIRHKCDALQSAIETGIVSADDAPEGAARLYLAAKAIASQAESAARAYADDAPIPVGIGRVLGFKPGEREEWSSSVVDIFAQLRADGASDDDLREWFPGASVSKKALEEAATVLLKRGEIECSPWEYAQMFREKRPSVTFTTFMEETSDE